MEEYNGAAMGIKSLANCQGVFTSDGYIAKCSAQDTDFNGIISFMMNCTHFDSKFSFIAPGNTYPPCLLTKAREIGRTVRHSPQCKVTDADLQDIFTTLISLLTDPTCLANDVASQEAVKKLAKLQNDGLKITTEEMVHLLDVVQEKLQAVEHIAEKTLDEIRVYLERCKNDLMEHTDTCKRKLDDHAEKCKDALDRHCRKSAESNYEQACEDLRRRLMEHYNDTSSNVPLSTLDQSLDKRIQDIYATPKIHRIDIKNDGIRKKEEQVNFYKEIFYKKDHGHRRIYVQGEPGSGKSTFAAKLVHDWCHGIQPSSSAQTKKKAFDDIITIKKFKFLFYITFRDVRGQKDIPQMIKSQLVDRIYSEDDLDDVYKLFQQIIETEQCLIVRDGLDEWVAPDGCNLAEPSMTGFQKEQCTVLTTSRPWKLADERIKNSQIDILLEIEGICDPDKFCENILRCIIDETRDLDNTVMDFQKFVANRQLKSLSCSPMLYTLVICTWVDTMKEKEPLQETSLCALYTSLIESLCKKANSKIGYFNDSNPSPVKCFSSTHFLKQNIHYLNKLADAAFKLLFSFERETSIVFSDITLSNYFSPEEFTDCKKFALNAGILTSRKDKSRAGSSNSFIHKTVQEFFAAYHIARNTQAIGDSVVRYLKCYYDSYLDISQVFIFLCGMNTIAANELSVLMNKCDVQSPCGFQTIIEDGIREAAENKQDGLCLKLSHFYIDNNNIRDLHRVFSANNSDVKSLNLDIALSDSESSDPKLSDLRLSDPKLRYPKWSDPKSSDPESSDRKRGHQKWSFPTWTDSESSDPESSDPESSDPESNIKFHVLCSRLREKTKSHFEFNLSSCLKLKELRLQGYGILLKDSASFTTSELPVWIALNNAEPLQCGDPSSVLQSIEYIELCNVTCSSSWLRGLFSTLLTLDHEVKCTLVNCIITSSVVGPVRRSSTYAKATIRTGLNNTFHMRITRKIRPSFWEALYGLNIKRLGINGLNKDLMEHFSESLLKSLQSLKQLDTLNIYVDAITPDLWKALHTLNIESMTLSQNGRLSGLVINPLSRLSQILKSPTQIGTIYIDVNVHPDLLKVLYGLSIKILSLCGSEKYLKLINTSALLKLLSSLKQINELDVIGINGSPRLWKALHGLNIKSLSLIFKRLSCERFFAFKKLLLSQTQLKTLSIEVSEDSDALWFAVPHLNITCLSVSFSGGVKHVSHFAQSLASLAHLETLSINVSEDCTDLWYALRGLNITCLSLSGGALDGNVTDVKSLAQLLSSLTQLATLSIKVPGYSQGLWEVLQGLTIKSLHLNDRCEGLLLSHIQLQSSLTQLETLTIYVHKYEAQELPQSLKFFNIYCDELFPFQLRKLVDRLSACTQRVEIKLEFGCAFNYFTFPVEEYITIQQELVAMKNVKVTRFLIYSWKPSIGTGSDWCLQNVDVDVDGHHDDDIGDDLYKQFIDNLAELNRFSIRLNFN